MAPESPRVARPRVLLVDDEPRVVHSLRRQLEIDGFEGLEASDRASLLAQLVHRPEVVLLDMRLGEREGPDLIGEIRTRSPGTQVVVMTSHASVDSTVACMRAGALDVIQKPFGEGQVRHAMQRAVARGEAAGGSAPARAGEVIAHSPAMRRVLAMVRDLSRSESTVLIEAESGTGKELIARAIHDCSQRGDRSFVPVDCGALPEGMIEGELFGYQRGAFTGAVRASLGLFRSAHKGTLFLDEIGELPLLVQSKLLRSLQAREVRPLGQTDAVPIDVRIVAATNRDLSEEVRAGRFRADLFYRLCVVSIPLPPLRERREDIPPLTEHFLARAQRAGHQRVQGIEPDALKQLVVRDWPGNVRELENAIEAAVALARGPRLTIADLRGRGDARQRAKTPEGLELSLAAYERACLEATLCHVNGDVRAAARLLGIGRSTLYRKLERHGL